MFELLSFESLKDLLGLNDESISEYPALQTIKLSILAAFEEELGRELELKERTTVIRSRVTSTRYIDLVGLPISSVASVTLTDVYGISEELDAEDYAITDAGVRLITAISNVEIEVVYTGGYEDKAPPALERAALIQTSYEYQNKDNIGASSVTTEGGTVSIPELQLLKAVRKILDGFKHPSRTS